MPYREQGTRDNRSAALEVWEKIDADNQRFLFFEFMTTCMDVSADQGCFVLALEHERKFS